MHAACWAHARRKFFDAVKLNPKDTTSIQIVAQMEPLNNSWPIAAVIGRSNSPTRITQPSTSIAREAHRFNTSKMSISVNSVGNPPLFPSPPYSPACLRQRDLGAIWLQSDLS